MTKTTKASKSANQVFAEAMPSAPQPKKQKHNVLLSDWIEKQDKQGDKALAKSMFRKMAEEQRGFNANVRFFQQWKDTSEMEALLRWKGFKCSKADLAIVFTADFICDNLNREQGSYRFDSKKQICSVYLPKTAEKQAEAEMQGFDAIPQNENDKKRNVQRFLKPLKVYTFGQFATLAKVAVDNYRRTQQAELCE